MALVGDAWQFSYAGDAWLSLQYVCAFGAVSFVWNFHRVGNWLLRFLRTKAVLPALKYVDDFFGVSRRGLRFAPTDVMSIIFSAFGLELDGRKSECFQSALVVLGAKVVVSWMKRSVAFSLSEEKRTRWVAELLLILKSGTMSPMQAEQYIGRLG